MYRPNSLDEERISWKTVIYFNVVHSLKHILNTLEAWDDVLDEDDDNVSIVGNGAHAAGIAGQPSPSTSYYNSGGGNDSPSSVGAASSSSDHSHTWTKDNSTNQIAALRRKLSPLVFTDAQLADRLSGGIAVSGSGKGSVYVRGGWQARTLENALGRLSGKRPNSEKKERDSISTETPSVQDVLILDVARMLALFESDIKELWNHPTVKGMIAKRRLKLDEWSELCVVGTSTLYANHLQSYSFLKHIARVAASDYIPSTGK
jgi:guanine nucleotide-binding protein subunit alpha